MAEILAIAMAIISNPFDREKIILTDSEVATIDLKPLMILHIEHLYVKWGMESDNVLQI